VRIYSTLTSPFKQLLSPCLSSPVTVSTVFFITEGRVTWLGPLALSHSLPIPLFHLPDYERVHCACASHLKGPLTSFKEDSKKTTFIAPSSEFATVLAFPCMQTQPELNPTNGPREFIIMDRLILVLTHICVH
jgi:hypothetical protein